MSEHPTRWLVAFVLLLLCGNLCPAEVITGDDVGSTQTLLDGVPSYLWHHGCGPTALGMVMGYWDMHGYGDLIPGNSNTQTAAVDSAIASEEHYNDYVLPLDDYSTGILPDKSELGGAHEHNSIADWMHTSWSDDNNLYGWSVSIKVDDAARGYTQWKGYDEFYSYYIPWGWFSFSEFTTEIDEQRPMVMLVDTDGNGYSDHFVTVIGYDEVSMQYACYNTWDHSVHWYDFAERIEGQPWGIAGITIINAPMIPEPTTLVLTMLAGVLATVLARRRRRR